MRLSTFLEMLSAFDVGVGELLDIPEIVVMRESRLGRAMERLVANPELGGHHSLRALLAYRETGEPAAMEFDPPLHVIHDGRGTLAVRFERDAFVRFLPLAL